MRSHGAKARTKISPPVSLLFEFDLPIATIGVRRPMPKNGFSSNGPKVKASRPNIGFQPCRRTRPSRRSRSEEHTSELQSLMRISYDVFCLNKKTIQEIY